MDCPKTLLLVCLALTIVLRSGHSDHSSSQGNLNSETWIPKVSQFIAKQGRGIVRRFLRRKIHIPEGSELGIDSQVSRPNAFPNLFNQDEGLIVDAVVELPLSLDMAEFAQAAYGDFEMYKSGVFAGLERCWIYKKIEKLVSLLTQLGENSSHGCLLKFICEIHAIHSFYPEHPNSLVFEFIHLVLTPSLASDDVCYLTYVKAENFGKHIGKCWKYAKKCSLSVRSILLRNFFPDSVSDFDNIVE